MNVEQGRALGEMARRHGLASHLDGARIFNAAAALGVEVKALTEPFGSVMFCISRGLCAPVGSLLCGSKGIYPKALKVRKMMVEACAKPASSRGGARGLGPGRAPSPRRSSQSESARRTSSVRSGLRVDLESLQTNIVMLKVNPTHDGARVGEVLKARGILCHVISPTQIRFVTHHDISEPDLQRALAAPGAAFLGLRVPARLAGAIGCL